MAPSMKAALACAETGPSMREAARQGIAGLVQNGGRDAGDRKVATVDRGHHAADDGDAERAADLAGQVVHGRTDALLPAARR